MAISVRIDTNVEYVAEDMSPKLVMTEYMPTVLSQRLDDRYSVTRKIK